MLLCLQFPLADARGFVADTRRLSTPQWQLPEFGTDFVRYIGPLRRRKAGPLQGWVSENTIADARRALQFTSLALALENDFTQPVHGAFRRFLCDGLTLGKFEVGLDNWDWLRARAAQLNVNLETLVSAALRLPVKVSDPPGPATAVDLGAAGPALASLYCAASTSQDKGAPFEPANWWVRAGQPIVLAQYRTDAEPISLPAHARDVALGDAAVLGKLRLSHFYVPFQGKDIRVWALGYASKASLETVRRLRVYLTRLHAEHECLRLILRSVSRKQLVVAQGEYAENFQRYINEATRRVSRLEDKPQGLLGAAVPEIAEVVRASDNPFDSAEREQLYQALDGLNMRPNVDRKLRDYADQWWDRAKFRDAMVSAFRLEDIELICDDLHIQYDDIPHETLTKAVMRLIEYCEQRDRRQELVERCQHYRPARQWTAF
jgi:hypothetical protein